MCSIYSELHTSGAMRLNKWHRSARAGSALSIIVLQCIIAISAAYAQNLVPNPSFEILQAGLLPNDENQLESRCRNWIRTSSDHTSDYFYFQTQPCDQIFAGPIPDNAMGSQEPQGGGMAYAGLGNWDIGGGTQFRYREYIAVRLLPEGSGFRTGLQAGARYELSFWVSLAEISTYGVARLGAVLMTDDEWNNRNSAFSSWNYNISQSSWLNLTEPHVHTGNADIPKDTWTLISNDQFVAKGGEEWLLLGNFDNMPTDIPSATPTPRPCPNWPGNKKDGYYYIDDVSVERVADPFCECSVSHVGALPAVVKAEWVDNGDCCWELTYDLSNDVFNNCNIEGIAISVDGLDLSELDVTVQPGWSYDVASGTFKPDPLGLVPAGEDIDLGWFCLNDVPQGRYTLQYTFMSAGGTPTLCAGDLTLECDGSCSDCDAVELILVEDPQDPCCYDFQLSLIPQVVKLDCGIKGIELLSPGSAFGSPVLGPEWETFTSQSGFADDLTMTLHDPLEPATSVSGRFCVTNTVNKPFTVRYIGWNDEVFCEEEISAACANCCNGYRIEMEPFDTPIGPECCWTIMATPLPGDNCRVYGFNLINDNPIEPANIDNFFPHDPGRSVDFTGGIPIGTLCHGSQASTPGVVDLRIEFLDRDGNVMCDLSERTTCGSGGGSTNKGATPENAGADVSLVDLGLKLSAAPNPTAGKTTIHYSLPESAAIQLELYNSLGQSVAVLASGQRDKGLHGLEVNTLHYPAGVYYLRLSVNDANLSIALTIRR